MMLNSITSTDPKTDATALLRGDVDARDWTGSCSQGQAGRPGL
jgi:hypothetical protein